MSKSSSMSRLLAVVAALGLLLPLAAAADPLDDLIAEAVVSPPWCEALDPARCLLPWPSDTFTTADPSTPTGLRLDLPVQGMPRNVTGRPIDPTEWNRNDGFSPGTAIMTMVPGLDMSATFGVENTIVDPDAHTTDDSAVLVVNLRTGERHPVWAERDTHPDTAPEESLLIIRPLRNFTNGDRYLVVLRDLSDGSDTIAPPAAGPTTEEWIEPALVEMGLDVDGLYLAWDFTVASADNVTGRARAIRDDAFRRLGDHDLSDGIVPADSRAPGFTVTSWSTDPENLVRHRRVEGTITVPNYLTIPQETRVPPALPSAVVDQLPAEMADGYDDLAGLAQHVPGYRLHYGTPTPGPMDVPQVNPASPTAEIGFTCVLPHPSRQDGQPSIGMLYGHGLLGSRSEMTGSSADRMRERGYGTCAVDWAGMSTPDIANVALLLADMSNFPSLPDRAQQGFVHFMLLGRAMIHPDGFAAHEAFQVDGAPLLHTAETAGDLPALVYDGNSQGGIMGGALTALSPDVTRATLGVVGMNYSVLLNRSVDFEGKGAYDPADNPVPAYAAITYAFYPDKVDQQIVFQLIQTLWDRGENSGYANHLSTPLPNSPANQVLLHPALGDYQVANVSAEMLGRSVGAAFEASALEPGLHWSDDPLFGFTDMAEGCTGCSAVVYWDSGNSLPPNGNVPPQFLDADPHEHPRRDQRSGDQRDVFYRTGTITDVFAGAPYRSDRFPVHGYAEDGSALRAEDNGH